MRILELIVLIGFIVPCLGDDVTSGSTLSTDIHTDITSDLTSGSVSDLTNGISSDLTSTPVLSETTANVEVTTNPSSSTNPTVTVTEEDKETQTDSNSPETTVYVKTTTENTGEDIILTETPKREDISSTTGDDSVGSTVYTTDLGKTTVGYVNVSECDFKPCKNGGVCLEKSSTGLPFVCECSSGFIGLLCGVKDVCERNEEGIFCKKGVCVYSEDGGSRHCGCFGGMFWDDERKECRNKEPPCFPNPCENGGTCQESENNEYRCQCATGYEGDTCSVKNECGGCTGGKCELDTTSHAKICKCSKNFFWNEQEDKCSAVSPPCSPNPCKNSGDCRVLEEGKFNCTCKEGFSGTSCEILEICNHDVDCEGGTCTLHEKENAKKCICGENYYLDENVQKCREMKTPCHPNPCLNDGICLAVSSSDYNCSCSDGYAGPRCDARDYCKMDGGDAICGDAECKSDADKKAFSCLCQEGQAFDYSLRKCTEIDMCPLIKCGPLEECVSGVCQCIDNFKWNNTTIKCEADFCPSKPCPSPDMVCEDDVAGSTFSCSCKEGYSFNGTHCNAAFCVFPNLNDCSQNCEDTTDGYKCSCHPGFQLEEDNKTCIYVQNGTCTNKTCDGGWCVLDDDNAEVCVCPSEYIEVNGKCIDLCTAGELPSGLCPIDECKAVPDKGFRCKCNERYATAENGVTCVERDMCAEKAIGRTTCDSRNSECIADRNSTRGFRCQCREGEAEDEDGVCTGLCSLEENMLRCFKRGAVCDVIQGKNTCSCPPFFKYNSEDQMCNKPADISYLFTFPMDLKSYLTKDGIDYTKALEAVTLAMEKLLPGFLRSNILSCRTENDYSLCKFEFQFSHIHKMDLRRLRVTDLCISGEDTAQKCLMPPTLVLRKSRINSDVTYSLTNPCDSDMRAKLCGSDTTCTASEDKRSFNCACKEGFSARRREYPFDDVNSFVELCQDIDECATENPCVENSECFNTIGSYYCRCKVGYRSVKDSSKGAQCFEICNPSPCVNGQCRRRGDHGFECDCDRGYRGSFCDMKDEYLKDAKVNTIIVGVVLGGVLLIVCILFFVCVSRLRNQKNFDNSGTGLYNSSEMTERRRVGGPAVNNAFQRE